MNSFRNGVSIAMSEKASDHELNDLAQKVKMDRGCMADLGIKIKKVAKTVKAAAKGKAKVAA